MSRELQTSASFVYCLVLYCPLLPPSFLVLAINLPSVYILLRPTSLALSRIDMDQKPSETVVEVAAVPPTTTATESLQAAKSVPTPTDDTPDATSTRPPKGKGKARDPSESDDEGDGKKGKLSTYQIATLKDYIEEFGDCVYRLNPNLDSSNASQLTKWKKDVAETMYKSKVMDGFSKGKAAGVAVSTIAIKPIQFQKN